MTGFELEDSQYVPDDISYLIWSDFLLDIFCVLAWHRRGGLRTGKQLADLQEKWNGLLWLIQNWCAVQLVYLSHVVSLLTQPLSPPEFNTTTVSSTPEILAENIPLLVPSALPHHIHNLPELEELCKLEQHLCEPQANDALASIWCQHHVIQGLWQQLDALGIGNWLNMKMLMLNTQCHKKWCRLYNDHKVQCSTFNTDRATGR